MKKERISVAMMITPEMDPRAAAKVLKDAADLHKRLSSVKIDFKELSKGASKRIADIRALSDASKNFSKDLSKAAKDTSKHLRDLGKQLEEAQENASTLKALYEAAGDETTKKSIGKELDSASKSIHRLTGEIDKFKKTNGRQIAEIKKTSKLHDRYQKQLGTMARYTGRDATKDILKAIGKGFTGGPGGLRNALSSATDAATKGGGGALARGALSADAAGMDTVAATLGKAAGALSGAVLAISAVWEFVKAASEHQTKLNKALTEGLGTANDMAGSTKRYANAVADLRDASQDSAWMLLKFGANSETAAKAINAFAKETTGSIVKTRDTMESLGGDTQAGVKQFVQSAVIYGKALGMETNEASTMMGKWVSEVGYGTSYVQDLLGDVVKMASTANMPVYKFMDIFRQTVPNLELFTNRIEELAGTIKLLSKTMSPQDVKKFMDAFGKGYKGMAFKERLGHTLVAGVGKTNDILKKDFADKAKSLAAGLPKGLSGAFMKAFKEGDKGAMNDVLAQAKAGGMTPAQIGEAQKLFEAEKERKQGGPLSTASALKGGSLRTMVKIMQSEMATFGSKGRITGIYEQVAEKRGYSRDQIDSMNQFISSMELYTSTMKEYGTSGSKSMDEELRKIIAAATGKKVKDLTKEDMQKATEDQIAEAAENSMKTQKTQRAAIDIAAEQVSLTTSISDKIDNVLGFLLEKLYRVMQPILDLLNEIWGWMTGNDDQQETIKGIQAALDNYKGDGGIPKDTAAVMADSLTKMVNQGADSDKIAAKASEMFDPESLKSVTADALKAAGIENVEVATGSKTVRMKTADGFEDREISTHQTLAEAFQSGKGKEALAALKPEQIMKLIGISGVKASGDAANQGAGRSAMRREGTQDSKIAKTLDELDSSVGDTDDTISDLSGVWDKGGSKDLPQPEKKSTDDAAKDSDKAVESGMQKAMDADPQKKRAADAAEASADAGDDIYAGVSGTMDLLKKGIKFEQSWMNSKYKNVLKEATLDSFRIALFEFAVLQAQIGDNQEMKDALIKNGADLIESGKLASGDLIAGNKASGSWDDYVKDLILGARQSGGPIPETGLYQLHAGEHVLSADDVAKVTTGNRQVQASVIINGTGLTQQQLEGAVYGALDRVSRRA